MVKMFYNYFEKCDKYRKRGISVKKKVLMYYCLIKLEFISNAKFIDMHVSKF